MKIPLKIILLTLLSVFVLTGPALSSDGASLYLKYCSECHGREGKGAKAPALNKEGLLRTVGIDYIKLTVMLGRPTRGCPAHAGTLSADEIDEIALYVKGWQKGEMLEAAERDVLPAKTAKGEDLFTLCGGCHGLEGEGAMGPSLLDEGFLASITDTDLRRTIMWGRPGTPMKGYLKGGGGLTTLNEEEIDEIISYIRYRQNER